MSTDRPTTNLPRVTVVVVTYNSASVIGTALASLHGLADVDVVVVDNDSSDNTVSLIAGSWPGCRMIVNKENRGFAAAVNQGAASARGGAILLLNPDAIIHSAALLDCLDYLDRHPEVGVLAPLVTQPEGRLKVMEAGRSPTLRRVFFHYSGLSRLATQCRFLEGLYLLVGQAPHAREVDWVSGACMLVRHTTWRDLRGLTERWFMYAEDVDLCLRTRDLGQQVVLIPTVSASHIMGASSSKVETGPPKTVSSAWIINLFDLYKLRERPGMVASWCWRTVAVLGLLSRASAFSLRARRGGGDERTMWSDEARKFWQYAKDVARVEIR